MSEALPVDPEQLAGDGLRPVGPGLLSRAAAFLAERRKAVYSLVASTVGWAQLAYVPDGRVDRMEWVGLAVLLLGVKGVHDVTNAVGLYVPPEDYVRARGEPTDR